MAYASAVAGYKNTLKRAQGELEGLRRSDAVRVRRDDEAAMLAWLAKRPARRRSWPASARCRRSWTPTTPTASAISSCRSCVLACWARPQLQLALERGKPDAQREATPAARQALIGGLKRLQRRYDPEVEKATLRYAQALLRAAAGQRVPEFDAVFGTSEAGRRSGWTRCTPARSWATRPGWPSARPGCRRAGGIGRRALLKAAATLQPALLRQAEAKQRAGELLRLVQRMQALIIPAMRRTGRSIRTPIPPCASQLRGKGQPAALFRARDGMDYRFR